MYVNLNTYEGMKTNRPFGYHHCDFTPNLYLGHAMNVSFILKFIVPNQATAHQNEGEIMRT